MAFFAPPGLTIGVPHNQRDGQFAPRTRAQKPGQHARAKNQEEEEEKGVRKHGIGAEIDSVNKRAKNAKNQTGGLTVRDIFTSTVTPVCCLCCLSCVLCVCSVLCVVFGCVCSVVLCVFVLVCGCVVCFIYLL